MTKTLRVLGLAHVLPAVAAGMSGMAAPPTGGSGGSSAVGSPARRARAVRATFDPLFLLRPLRRRTFDLAGTFSISPYGLV